MSFQDKGKICIKSGLTYFERAIIMACKGLNLDDPKDKWFNCQIAADCKICMKSYKYDIYKALQNHIVNKCLKKLAMQYIYI